jgi:nitronate monooxygenase
MDTLLTRDAGIGVPLICGAMYPCSNPELVAAVSEAGAIGIVQPVALTYVHGHEFRAGLRFIRSLTARPFGMNALIEDSSATYRKRMEQWIAVALEEGVRFFVTSLGNPKWVVRMVEPLGGIVYHDVTERKWAEKGAAAGARGFIAVNRRAGGHAGERGAAELLEELRPLGMPVVAAGGVGTAAEFRAMLDLGYAGVQCGTRFIATIECKASAPYKQAILKASADDIVLSERITGVPVAVIRTPRIDRMGLHAGAFARWMLRGRRRKRWMRIWYALRSIRQLKLASLDPKGGDEYWQAGRSVAGITTIEPAGKIVRQFAAALEGTANG